MPKLSGVFSLFKNLEKIAPQSLNHWLKLNENPYYLYNFIGNRILYSEVVPLSPRELDIDFAILKEAVRLNKQLFYPDSGVQNQPGDKKIIIPEEFVNRFPPLERLGAGMVEAIAPSGIVSVYIKTTSASGKNLELVGSVITPTLLSTEGEPQILINNNPVKVNLGTMVVFPFEDRHLRVKIDSLDEILVSGGKLGLIIDLRKGVNTP